MALSRTQATLALIAIGSTWGLTVPLGKIAVEAGHRAAGIIAWEFALTAICLAPLAHRGLARWRNLPFFAFIAAFGTLLPNSASYLAYDHLPAGVLSIIIAAVPMCALPVALALGLERPSLRRFAGVGIGMLAIALIAGPSAALPDPAAAPWILVALIPPICYAIEGNGLNLFGTGGLSPAELLFGASLIGLAVAIPNAHIQGDWIAITPWDAGKSAIVALTFLHVAAYAGYIWLVSAAGAVFASQVAYIVTVTGVGWSIAILSESYSGWIWSALALMLAGLALVAPQAPKDQNDTA